MICKSITGRDFEGLRDYLAKADAEVLDLRGVSCLELAPLEMELVSRLSERVTKQVVHFVIAWAKEDRLPAALRKTIIAELLATAGLAGHQALVMSHHDTDDAHDHAMVNKVSAETGRTAADVIFAKKGVTTQKGTAIAVDGTLVEGVRPDLPLTASQQALLRSDLQVRRCWDSMLLFRLQHAARDLEAAYGLRQLRTNAEVARDRREAAAGQGSYRAAAKRLMREARTGARPLLDMAARIAAALDLGSWSERASALLRLDIGLRPVLKQMRGGDQLMGLRLVDLADEGNFIAGSAIGARYSLKALEARTEGQMFFLQWYEAVGRTLKRLPAVARDAGTRIEQMRAQLHEEYLALRAQQGARRQAKRRIAEARSTEAKALERKRAVARREFLAAFKRRCSANGLVVTKREKAFAARVWWKVEEVATRALLGKVATRPIDQDEHCGRPLPTWREWLGNLAATGRADASEVYVDLARRIERQVTSGDQRSARPSRPEDAELRTLYEAPQAEVAGAVTLTGDMAGLSTLALRRSDRSR